MSWAEEVNLFWFDELSPVDWFSADPKVDAAIHGALWRAPRLAEGTAACA